MEITFIHYSNEAQEDYKDRNYGLVEPHLREMIQDTIEAYSQEMQGRRVTSVRVVIGTVPE